jgi:lysyl-tRNA synthetase class 2
MALLEDLDALVSDAATAFAAAKDSAALEAARVEFLGTRGRLKAMLGRMGEIPREQKPAVGKRANEVGAQIQAMFEEAKTRVSETLGSGASAETGSSYESLKQERLDKLKLYEERGPKLGLGSAWGAKFPPADGGKALTPIDEIRRKFDALDPKQHTDPQSAAEEVCLAARVMLRRDQSKKLIFLTAQDQSGSIQVALWNALLNEDALALLRDTLDLWDIVGVSGKLAFTQKGEPTVWATSIRMLSKCIAPPPDKHHGLHDKEIRYRQRYLDLITSTDSRKTFILRAKAVASLRRFLDDRGFLEMETPTLQTIPGGAAARPFETKLNALNMKMFLRIATEIPLKKLLVGGLEKVYELGRIFRNEGIDARHNPEFTTVELYQAYGDLRDMMALTENAVRHLAQSLTGSTTVTWRGKAISFKTPWPRLEYCELLKKHAGVSHDDVESLDRKLRELKINPEGMSQVDKIDGVFSELCEPHLQDACFVINQPVEMSPLCRAHPNDPRLADRFEAFAAGMEIANSYSELNDPIEQRNRLLAQLRASWLKFLAEFNADAQSLRPAVLAQSLELQARIQNDAQWHSNKDAAAVAVVEDIRKLLAAKSLPEKRAAFHLEQIDKLNDPSQAVDEDFVTALEHGMPPAGGLGIGVDRVVMLLAGVDSIRDVILFPLMRAEEKR